MANATATKTTRRYDPGTPGEVIPEGNGRFLVESFKKPGEHYSVDLTEGTCSCPHHIHRIAGAIERGETPAPCKHREIAELLSFWMAVAVARQLSATNLRAQLHRTDLRPEIRDAVRIVYHCRHEVEEVFENASADSAAVAIAA